MRVGMIEMPASTALPLPSNSNVYWNTMQFFSDGFRCPPKQKLPKP